MWTKINHVNIGKEKLRKVCYRNIDRHARVFRWDTRSYKDIFITGFNHDHKEKLLTLSSTIYMTYP